MNKFKLLIDKNTVKNIEQIFDYFSNHEVTVKEVEFYYQIELKRTDFLYVEDTKDINKVLKILNISSRNDILNYHIIGDNYIFSLLESWIPYGWSNFLIKLKADGNKMRKKTLVLLHIDDHSDLMPPIISINNGRWNDMITGKEINFFEPESVKEAIYSGAITLGSILTILLYSLPNIHVLHLKQRASSIKTYLEKVCKRDLIFTKQKVMSFKSTKNKYNSINNEVNSFYLRTHKFSDIVSSLRMFSNAYIFLHIDMDFFNNRFNGSSDWKNYSYSGTDLDISLQQQLMEEVFENLENADLIKNIQHISIGVSPGFYPLEYWEVGLSHLLSCMENVGLNISKLKNTLRL